MHDTVLAWGTVCVDNGGKKVALSVQNQRVPADMVFIRTTEHDGSCFIRTDQMDGETDWKLRLAVGTTQRLDSNVVSSL